MVEVAEMLSGQDMRALGLTKCPECEAWLELPDNPERVRCTCGAEFCSGCFEAGHKGTCEEAKAAVAAYEEWCATGRAAAVGKAREERTVHPPAG